MVFAAALQDVPVWVFHGAKNPTGNMEMSRSVVEALETAGADPKYTGIPDGDHGITDAVHGDDEFHQWHFAQRREQGRGLKPAGAGHEFASTWRRAAG
ncbi:MAG: hypothetical protein HKO57_17195 [Akkermansiaceae bacterium]|nr:hypothetical protein [Akkermansiaceae bacterium]